MAKKTGISDAAQEMKEFNKESASLVVVLQDLAKALKDNAKAASEFTGESVEAYTESTKEAIDLAKQLQGYTVQQLKTKKSQATFEDKLSKLQQNQARVASKITFLEEKRLAATKQEKVYIDKALTALKETELTLEGTVDEATKLSKRFEEIGKQTKAFDDLAEFFEEIPAVNKLFKEFQNAADASREAAVEGGSAFKAGAKELSGAVGKILVAFSIEKMIEGLNNADQRMVSLGRSLNKTTEESEHLVKSFNSAAREMAGLTGTELQKAAEGFATSMGSTAIVSKDISEELATQVKFMGQTEESANKFAKYSLATGQNAKKLGNQIRGQVIASNALNRTTIRYQDILSEVSNASASIKLSTKGIGANITQAAIASKKLGLDLAGVDKIADSLLNFEESISAEMDAELLTGQDLNLEEARRLALNNDLAGVANEIAKQGITSEKFSKMNRIQQESIAKAMGMSREEMSEMFLEQKALSALGAKDKTEAEAKVKAKLDEINKIKDLSKREAARSKLINELGSEELVRQRENQTLAEKQAEANERLVEAMDLLIPILEPIKKAFEFIAEHAQSLAKVLMLLVGGSLIGKLGNMIKMLRGVGGGMKGLASTVGDVASSVSGGGGGGVGATGKKLSEKQIAAGFGGKAAKDALQTGAKGGGGFFSKIGNFFGDMGKKLNPVNWVKGKLGKVVGKILKFPLISTLIESLFAGSDISNIIAEGGSQNEVYKKIGIRGGEALGSIGGSAVGAILGSALGPLGTAAGGFLGDTAGRWLGGQLTEMLGPETFGKTIAKTFGYDKDIEEGIKGGTINAKDYVIKTLPEDTVVGAGGTKLGRTDEMVGLLEKLISTIEKGGNVYLDGNKVGTAMAVSTYKTQ